MTCTCRTRIATCLIAMLASLSAPGCAANGDRPQARDENQTSAESRDHDRSAGSGMDRQTRTVAETTPAQPPAGAAQEYSPFREFGPRAHETIFSPLDLPTPSNARLASGVPGPGYWQNTANHEIHATLDTDADRIHATQTITYTNNSPHELDFIWLHLEQNLFDPHSRGARMTQPGDRFGNRGAFEGGLDIASVSIRREKGETRAPSSQPFTTRSQGSTCIDRSNPGMRCRSIWSGRSRSRRTARTAWASSGSRKAPSTRSPSGSPLRSGTTTSTGGTPCPTSARASSTPISAPTTCA